MALRDLLRQAITIEPYLGRNPYGEPIYGAPVSCPCRIEQQYKLIRDRTGTEVVSKAQIYLTAETAVSPEDRITLPDSTQPPILAVSKTADGQGRDFLQVVFT